MPWAGALTYEREAGSTALPACTVTIIPDGGLKEKMPAVPG
jgi:hypothetical protein